MIITGTIMMISLNRDSAMILSSLWGGGGGGGGGPTMILTTGRDSMHEVTQLSLVHV